MNEGDARKILGPWLESPASGLSGVTRDPLASERVVISPARGIPPASLQHHKLAYLRGNFTADELEAFAWWMRHGLSPGG